MILKSEAKKITIYFIILLNKYSNTH